MPNYKEYFDLHAYQPKYFIGDRVFGHYEKIPFIGSVGNDALISNEAGARVSVHLDLPLKTKTAVLNIVFVKHKDIKKLKIYDDEAPVKTNKKQN